jgi:hypothetical protein
MSFYANESDAYTEWGSGDRDERALALVREYHDARAALLTITPDMDRTQRWMILDRVATATMRLGVQQDTTHYGAVNAQIVREIRGAA